MGLLTVAEICRKYEINRSVLWRYRQGRKSIPFPEPCAENEQGKPQWDEDDTDEWHKRRRPGGRPRKTAT
jgi:transposase-like protein